jgi:hypothetical protein
MRFPIIGGVDTEAFATSGPGATNGPAYPRTSEKELEERDNLASGSRGSQVEPLHGEVGRKPVPVNHGV